MGINAAQPVSSKSTATRSLDGRLPPADGWMQSHRDYLLLQLIKRERDPAVLCSSDYELPSWWWREK